MTRKLTNLEKLQLQQQELKNLYINMMVTMKESLVKSEKILAGIVEDEEVVPVVPVVPEVEEILFVGYKFRMLNSDLQIEDIPHDRQLKIPCTGMYETVKDGFINKAVREFHITRESIEEIVLAERAAKAEAEAAEAEAKEILETEEVA